MKGNIRILFAIILCGLITSNCYPASEIQVTATPVQRSTETLVPLPTLAPFSTPTLLPLSENVFDNFQQTSANCRVGTAFGSVLPGETVEERILIDSTLSYPHFFLGWREGDLDMILIQPDGTEVDPSMLGGEGTREEFVSNAFSEEYVVHSKQTGIWIAKIYGKTALDGGSAYEFEVSPSANQMEINFDFDEQEYFSGEPIRFSAELKNLMLKPGPTQQKPVPIQRAKIEVIVEGPTREHYEMVLYDDGQHGDKKKNDGIYADVFKDTFAAGIYKFYAKISGSNNMNGDPFVRECFWAKTVNPAIPPTTTAAPGDEKNSCEHMQTVSEPILVRDGNEGGNDSSIYSRFAFYPKAISTENGILVTWHMGFDGIAPQPNVYMRLLNEDAHPLGNVEPLFERNQLGVFYSLLRTNDSTVVGFCGRYNKNEDRNASIFLDAYGHVLSDQMRSPSDRDCAYTGPEAIWTGSRLMFAWTDLSSAPVQGDEVLFEVADRDGKSLFWRQLHSQGIDNPHFALGHGQVLLAVNTLGSEDYQVTIHRFDLEGNELGDAIVVHPAPFDRNGKIVSRPSFTPHVFPVEDGWMLIGSAGTGIYVARLALDGSLVSGPVVRAPNITFSNGFTQVLPYRGGAIVLGGSTPFVFVSKDGLVTLLTDSFKETEGMGSISLFEHQGKLFSVYTKEMEKKPGQLETNQVLIREWACTP